VRACGRAAAQILIAISSQTSVASTAGDLGYSDSTIGAMLGHAGGTITSRYVHHRDAVLIAAADRVAGQVANGLLDAP
jgi:hypothetical protein